MPGCSLVPEPRSLRANRLGCACVVAVVAILGLATKFYAGPGAGWVSGYLGGFFYVVFWVFVILSIAPGASPGSVALWVFGVTCVLELLQLWHPPILEGIRSNFFGHALIGSTFSGWDFAYYGLAAMIAPALARRVRLCSSA